MFKGTEKHPAGEFGAKVAEIGGEQYAFTWVRLHRLLSDGHAGGVRDHDGIRS
ncbi:hypothetical protein [Mesorhizobium onobrychidis]|uniref:hypothetical protein n=1 Tax=Mesorhizobium onobrychidis TaxID=2775404 RepID=UPI0035A9333D